MAATTSPTDASQNEISKPHHYAGPVPGIECIEVSQYFPANLAQVIQYIWRCDYKGTPMKDLLKARKFLDFEINKRAGRKPHAPIDSHPEEQSNVAVHLSQEVRPQDYIPNGTKLTIQQVRELLDEGYKGTSNEGYPTPVVHHRSRQVLASQASWKEILRFLGRE
jgi:hypothetical protein